MPGPLSPVVQRVDSCLILIEIPLGIRRIVFVCRTSRRKEKGAQNPSNRHRRAKKIKTKDLKEASEIVKANVRNVEGASG